MEVNYNYIAAYEIRGINANDLIDTTIYQEGKSRATIVSNIEPYCTHIDRRLAASGVILSGGDFSSALLEVKERRLKTMGNSPYLIFEASDIESAIELDSNLREFDDFNIFLDYYNELPEEDFSSTTEKILVAISLVMETTFDFRKIADCTVYYKEGGKPTYITSIGVKGSSYASRPLWPEDEEAIRKLIPKVIMANQYSTPVKLLFKSKERDGDQLLSFIAAWSCLEIFIEKTFSSYKKNDLPQLVEKLPRALRESTKSNGESLQERARNGSDGKFTFREKVAFVCADLSPEQIDSTLEKFNSIKSKRNKLIHKGIIEPEALPVTEAQKLAEELLRHRIE